MIAKLKTFALDHPILVGYAQTAAIVVTVVVVTTKIDMHRNPEDYKID